MTNFAVDYAKRATSGCKKCKQKLQKEELRLAKIVPNPFSGDGGADAGDMKQYFHPKCLFETFERARSTTKIIETPEDVDGWADLEQKDKDDLLAQMEELAKKRDKKGGGGGGATKKKPSTAASTSTAKAKATSPKPIKGSPKKASAKKSESDEESADGDGDGSGEDEKDEESAGDVSDSWDSFCSLCDSVAAVSAYTQKTNEVKRFIEGRQKDEAFSTKSLTLLMKLLLPGVVKRVYNVSSKQLIKLLADIFDVDATDMTDHLNACGDVSETIPHFFERNKRVKISSSSTLTLQEVDDWLEELTQYTKEDDQSKHLLQITKKCTPDDLKYIIREIKHDLRINAGAKHILDALDPDAYTAFQASRDLGRVVKKVLDNRGGPAGLKKALSVGIQLGVPVLPMLAEACRSVAQALKKCPNGMFAEIKYDGERVQLHKEGKRFKYYSRSLKPVQKHKIQLFEEFIPKAFPGHDEKLDIILDSEVLLVDRNGKPLPFGSLGKHKKEAFTDANVALFIFDVLMFDGVSLMNEPLEKRKKVLQDHMKEIPNRILFSEAEFIPKGDPQKALPRLLRRCFNEGLEGLVLKDIESKYEPGKRHWLKVKKDYLNEGAMADSADLLVLGAYYGTGNKGGLMSVFLMGSYDAKTKTFCTVTKCGNGLDDAGIDKVNKKLKTQMNKIGRDYDKLPTWLKCSRQLVPDFVMKDPKTAPVWEICGAEFSKSDAHTAAGISIRFPRVTKIRDDKDWLQATNLDELKALYAKSKERADFGDDDEEAEEDKASVAPKPAVAHTALNKLFEKWEEAEEKPGSAESSPSKAKAEASPSKAKVEPSPSKAKASPGRTPTKRKADEDSGKESDEGASPSKKAKTRKKCQYGAKCFRKNPQHKKEFWHPGDDDGGESEESKESDEDSKDSFFDKHIFYVAPECKKTPSELKRYLVYFGGEITDDPETATHVLAQEGEDATGALLKKYFDRVVDVDWAWKCIKSKKLLPDKEYRPEVSDSDSD